MIENSATVLYEQYIEEISMTLVIENIHKSFGNNHVFEGASTEIKKGRIYALLGRNGSGKTTLFDLISSRKPLDEGSISIEEDGIRREIDQRDLFYMVANPYLPNFMTSREFLSFFIDVNQDHIREERTIDELFDWIELRSLERDKLISSYSLGTRNKLQMLMFLLLRPPIILMDEPLTSLDVVVQLQIKKLLKEIEEDHIIIFSTHILQLARDLCDELIILNDKRLSLIDDNRFQDQDYEQNIIELLREKGDEHV